MTVPLLCSRRHDNGRLLREPVTVTPLSDISFQQPPQGPYGSQKRRVSLDLRRFTSRVASLVPLMALWLLMGGCGQITHLFSATRTPDRPLDRAQQALTARMQAIVEPDLRDNLNTALPAVRAGLADQTNKIAKFKRGLALRTLADPWDGLSTVEQAGLLAAGAAESGVEGLPAVIDILEGGMDRTATPFRPLTFPVTLAREDILGFLMEALEDAYQDREHALRHLSPQDREFLFTQGPPLVERFIPQITPPAQLTDAEAAVRYATLLMQQVDYGSLITAAQRLARLGNRKFLQQLDIVFHNRTHVTHTIRGITGEVLLAQQTPYGLVIIGGRGPNTYDLEKGAALIIDLGGNDTYRGSIGASSTSDLGNSIVIDLSGNDTYEPSPLGLATGRAGIGILIDHSGNDTYRLSPGSTKATGLRKAQRSAGSACWWIAPATIGIPVSAMRWVSARRWAWAPSSMWLEMIRMNAAGIIPAPTTRPMPRMRNLMTPGINTIVLD